MEDNDICRSVYSAGHHAAGASKKQEEKEVLKRAISPTAFSPVVFLGIIAVCLLFHRVMIK